MDKKLIKDKTGKDKGKYDLIPLSTLSVDLPADLREEKLPRAVIEKLEILFSRIRMGRTKN